MEKKTETTGGIGFCGCLTILFIALKLCDKIDWSWWLVLAPIWGPVALVLAGFVVICIFGCIVAFVEWIKSKF
jgi:hypothetical protein